MNILTLLRTHPIWQSWEKFYIQQEWSAQVCPPPQVWDVLQEQAHHFTPEIWLAWEQNAHLKNILPTLRSLFQDPDWIEQCYQNKDFMGYVDYATCELAYAYGFAHFPSSKTVQNIIYGVVCESLAKSNAVAYYAEQAIRIIRQHEHVEYEKLLNGESVYPYFLQQHFITNFYERITEADGILFDFACQALPYIVGRAHYATRATLRQFVHQHQDVLIARAPQETLIQILTLLNEFSTHSILDKALQQYPEFVHHDIFLSLMLKNAQYDAMSQPLIAPWLQKQYPEHFDEIKDNLAAFFTRNPQHINAEIVDFALKHQPFAFFLADALKKMGAITFTKKTWQKKWLSWSEKQLNLSEKSLVLQWEIMQCLDEQAWHFTTSHSTIEETNLHF